MSAMIKNRRVLCAVLSLSIGLGWPLNEALAQAPEGASCAQEIDQSDRDLKAFGRDVKDQNLDFVKTDVADTALSGIKRRLAGNPTSDALFAVKEQKKQFDEWMEQLMKIGPTMEELKLCIATPGCSLQKLAERQNEATAQWIQSLGNEGINAATERVNKAASLIQGYAQRASSMAEGSALRAVENCTEQFEQRVQSQTGALVTPEPSQVTPGSQAWAQSAPAAATPVAASSSGAGEAIVGGVLGLGIGLGIVAAVKKKVDADAAAAAATSSSSSSCGYTWSDCCSGGGTVCGMGSTGCGCPSGTTDRGICTSGGCVSAGYSGQRLCGC